MNIRQATIGDMPVLIDLIRRSFSDVAKKFGLTKDNCPTLEKATPDTCYLERLGVLPEKRRNGFGKVLVQRVFFKGAVFGYEVDQHRYYC